MEEQVKTEDKGLMVNPGTITTVIGSNASKIAEMIMDNIDKVQKDPKYIPQAEAVNAQLKTLVELGKSEIEMIKVSAFLNAK